VQGRGDLSVPGHTEAALRSARLADLLARYGLDGRALFRFPRPNGWPRLPAAFLSRARDRWRRGTDEASQQKNVEYVLGRRRQTQ
jgi:hypothetical protein